MELVCRLLEVSRSGYYEWLGRKPSSRKRIHRLMNEMNISSTRRRAYKATTNSRHAHPIAPNLLARRFSFDKPDTAWVGDITYIPTGEGWLYCAVVKDLCTKQIVGYAFSDRIDTKLTLAASSSLRPRAWPSGIRKPIPMPVAFIKCECVHILCFQMRPHIYIRAHLVWRYRMTLLTSVLGKAFCLFINAHSLASERGLIVSILLVFQ